MRFLPPESGGKTPKLLSTRGACGRRMPAAPARARHSRRCAGRTARPGSASSTSTVRFQETASPVARAAVPICSSRSRSASIASIASRQRHGVRWHDPAVDAVAHEFRHPARVAHGQHRLAGLHRFERDEPHVLLERNEDDEVRARVMRDQFIVGEAAGEADPRIAFGKRVQRRRLRALACDHQRGARPAAAIRLDQQVQALGAVESAGREHELAALPAEAFEIGGMRNDLDVGAGRKVVRALRHRLRDREIAPDRTGHETDPVERVHDGARERAGKREQRVPVVLGDVAARPQRVEPLEQLRQRGAIELWRLQQIPQRLQRRRQLARVLRKIFGVGVVQAAQPMLQVDDVVVVARPSTPDTWWRSPGRSGRG